MRLFFLFAAVGSLLCLDSYVSAAPVLSELVATGNTSHLDQDGESPDWIEVHNPDAIAVDLGGYYLTDDPSDLTKWAFPATSLSAGAHLVVFASDKDRAVAGEELHANFKLSSAGEYLALIAPDGVTVISEFAPNFPVQVAGYSYGVASDSTEGFFETPSPGAANGAALGAPLLGPTIVPAGATFTTSVQVTLDNPSFPGGEIRYTTDGSAPTTSSVLYTGPTPLTVSGTTHLRAAVFDPVSGEGGAITGAHFVKMATGSDFPGLGDPATFTSNLPIVVVENFGAGDVPPKSSPTLQTARAAIYEVDPATGRSSLANAPDANLRLGIRIRGQTSGGVNFPKKQYKVELRDESDEDFDFPLLGLPEESDWIFNGPYIDKTFIRNSLAYSLGRTIGIEASRTRHFEMFLNTDGGDLAASEYLGVYVLLEKIKNGKNRTDIAALQLDENTEPEISGGYMMRFDQGGSQSVSGWGIEIIEPKATTSTQRNWIGDWFDDFAATLGWAVGGGPNDTGVINSDPVTGYPAYIDVDSFIHLMVINEMFNSGDSYMRSDYFFKERDGKLHKGPLWDFNQSSGTHNSTSLMNEWRYERSYNRGSGLGYKPDWFFPLMRDPGFRQKFIDRWFELRTTGILEDTRFHALIDGQAGPLTEASGRNFIRWPGILPLTNFSGFGNIGTDTWPEQIDALKDWFHTRMTWMDSEFLDPVSYSHGSGVLSAGTEVTLSGGGGGIYYTVDGSDPRSPTGRSSASAINLGTGGTVAIGSSVDIVARAYNGADWSAPSRATYVVGAPADATNLLITELNYHPPNPTASEVLADPTYNDDDFEFIELRNISSGAIDLGGVRFTEGIDYTFPAATLVPPGGYLLVVENASAFEERYGAGHPVAGVYANKMSNDGDTLRLVDLGGADIAHFTFNDIWYPSTDGFGETLVLVDERAVPSDYGSALSWEPSGESLGSPGHGDSPFGYWMASHFTPAEMADPSVSGPGADFEPDGLTTLMEFALGLDPKVVDSSGTPTGVMVPDGGQDYFALSFRRLVGSPGLTYRVQASGDLIDWSEELTVQVGVPVDNGDGTETVTIRDHLPLSGFTRRFLRLMVEEGP